MNEFFTNITSFPVVVFTFLLCLVIFYWLMVLLGILDLGEDNSGLDDGLGLEGISGLLTTLGLNGVPVTIVMSIMTSLAWFMTSIVTSIFFPSIDSPQVRLIAGIGLIVLVIVIIIPITARLIRPLRTFFHTQQGVSKSALIGRECEVKTMTVTSTFGQGEVSDGEAGIIVDINATEPNEIQKGDIVVLVEYDEPKDTFYVAKI